jgi:GAF domain-containing protein
LFAFLGDGALVVDDALAVLRSPGRLLEIAHLGLDRLGPRPYLDEIVAALAARVPAELVVMTAVLGDSQVFLAGHGPVPEWFAAAGGVPIEWSLCFPMVSTREPLVVPDLETDERFAGSPILAVPGGPRAYIGVPVLSPRGHMLGPLCAVDRRPCSFDPSLVPLMRELAGKAAALIEAHARESVS